MNKKKIFDSNKKARNNSNANAEINLTREAAMQNKNKWQLFLDGYRQHFQKEFSWPEYIKGCKLRYGGFNIHAFIDSYGPECEADFKRFRQRVLEQKGINKPSSATYSADPYFSQELLELLVNGDNLRSRMLIRFLNPQTRAEKRNLKRSWKNAKKMKFSKAEWMKSYVGIPFKVGKDDPVDDRFTRDEIFEMIKSARRQLESAKYESQKARKDVAPIREPEEVKRVEDVYKREVPISKSRQDEKELFANNYTSFIDESKINEDIVNNLSIFQPTQKVEFNKNLTHEIDKPIRLNEALSTNEKIESISKELNQLSDSFKGMMNHEANSLDDLLNDKELENFKSSIDNQSTNEVLTPEPPARHQQQNNYELDKNDFEAIANDLDALSESFNSLAQSSKEVNKDTTFEKINAAIQKTTKANLNIVDNLTVENTSVPLPKKTDSAFDLSEIIDINSPTPNVRQSSSMQISEELPKINDELNNILNFEKHISDQIKMVMEDNALISKELKKANEIKRTEERNYEDLKRQREELTKNLLNDDFLNSVNKK